jgi:hypothetical protein
MKGILTSLVVVFGIAQSSSAAPKWETDYGTALHSAQTAERPLVVVLENPHDPAQSIDKEALTSGFGRPELLGKFQLCRVDVTTKTGKLVAQAFRAEEFPYTAISDQKCKKIIHRQAGRPTPRKWVSMLAARVPRPRLRSALIQDSAVLWQQNCNT